MWIKILNDYENEDGNAGDGDGDGDECYNIEQN